MAGKPAVIEFFAPPGGNHHGIGHNESTTSEFYTPSPTRSPSRYQQNQTAHPVLPMRRDPLDGPATGPSSRRAKPDHRSYQGSQPLRFLLIVLRSLTALTAVATMVVMIYAKQHAMSMAYTMNWVSLVAAGFCLILDTFVVVRLTCGDGRTLSHRKRAITPYMDTLCTMVIITGFIVRRYMEPSVQDITDDYYSWSSGHGSPIPTISSANDYLDAVTASEDQVEPFMWAGIGLIAALAFMRSVFVILNGVIVRIAKRRVAAEMGRHEMGTVGAA